MEIDQKNMRIPKKILLGCFMLLMAGLMATTLKAETPLYPWSNTELGKLAGEASDLANQGEAIAIILVVGDDAINAGLSPEELQEAFQKRFDAFGVNAEFFVAYVGKSPTSISYVTQLEAFGPFGVRDAIENISAAVRQFQSEQEYFRRD
jgi:hypothetical protein